MPSERHERPSPARTAPQPGTEALPWLDRPDALQAIDARVRAGSLAAGDAVWLRQWVRDGYVTFDDVVPDDVVAAINHDTGAVVAEFGHLPRGELIPRFQNLFVQSAATRRAMRLPAILDKLRLLIGREPVPYQTLNLPVSSQQGAHSDAILMTTRPHGFMAAAWLALEDVRPDSGPLKLYAGSHRLPYVGPEEVGIPRGVSSAAASAAFDADYYPHIDRIVRARGLQPVPFLGRRGSIVIWHYNLLHGAFLQDRPDATRKSLIIHYFFEGADAFSDLWEWPAVIPSLAD